MVQFDDKELERRVDEVLYYIWDPIGVSNNPITRTEYAHYVPAVLKSVQDNDDIQPISDCLAEVVNENMGFSANKKLCDHTAEFLLKHKKAIEERYA